MNWCAKRHARTGVRNSSKAKLAPVQWIGLLALLSLTSCTVLSQPAEAQDAAEPVGQSRSGYGVLAPDKENARYQERVDDRTSPETVKGQVSAQDQASKAAPVNGPQLALKAKLLPNITPAESKKSETKPSPAPVVKPVQPRFALHLASYRRMEKLLLGWETLQKTYPDLLGGLEMQVSKVDLGQSKGVYLRLKAGSFPTSDAAARHCQRIKDKGGYCLVKDFGGTETMAVAGTEPKDTGAAVVEKANTQQADLSYQAGMKQLTSGSSPGDLAFAAQRFEEAANRGHVEAQAKLAEMYAAGEGRPQDFKRSAHWFERAARNGHPQSQFNLGVLFQTGRGVPQDFASARDWFEQAANAGVAEAQHNLAVLFANGIDTSKDYGKAAHWFSKAANQGHGNAQLSLGYLYEHGLGVEQDQIQAYKWYTLAAGRNETGAASRLDTLGAKLTVNELAAGKALARRWVPVSQ